MFAATLESLAGQFAGRAPDTTEENIQARIRGLLLMAISNKTGRMLLTTGNKSEMAVGYATLYGDMNGGFAPIKDCSKLLVYRLARYRNVVANLAGGSDAIHARVIEREPTAELRPDQKDTDSLPPYEVLDAILEAFIEEDLSVDEICARGFDRATGAFQYGKAYPTIVTWSGGIDPKSGKPMTCPPVLASERSRAAVGSSRCCG